MLTIAEAQRRTEEFLTGQMLDALRAVEYALPSFETTPEDVALDYAFAVPEFLENGPVQLYWRNDIVQMTRYYMLEAARCGVRLSPRRAGFSV